jgi:hypothetical protein
MRPGAGGGGGGAGNDGAALLLQFTPSPVKTSKPCTLHAKNSSIYRKLQVYQYIISLSNCYFIMAQLHVFGVTSST